MHVETISSTCLRLIDSLGKLDVISDFYLVGGTALSLQLGHRTSIDLDFFTDKQFSKNKITGLDKLGVATFPRIADNDLLSYINGVKVEFMYFAYPPQYPFIEWKGLRLIDIRDIGLFKLLTLLGRNHRKDIIDLYFINRDIIDLEELFTKFVEKYPKGDVRMFQNLEILFDDSAIYKSVMPTMIAEVDFEEAYQVVKSKIVNAVNKQLSFQV